MTFTQGQRASGDFKQVVLTRIGDGYQVVFHKEDADLSTITEVMQNATCGEPAPGEVRCSVQAQRRRGIFVTDITFARGNNGLFAVHELAITDGSMTAVIKLGTEFVGVFGAW